MVKVDLAYIDFFAIRTVSAAFDVIQINRRHYPSSGYLSFRSFDYRC